MAKGQTTAEVIELDIERGRDPRLDEEMVFNIDGEQAPDEEEFDYDERAPNLVVEFLEHPDGTESLRKLSRKFVGDFDSAWESTSEYREQKAKNWKIFTGDLPEKNFPYKNCANTQVPIMLENITRLQFRAAAELFGDWSNVFGVVPVSPDDDDDAELLSHHGNWQIREKITDFQRQQHRGLLMFFAHGDVTCHSYFDPTARANRHDMVTCDEFVVPYAYTTTMPDYSDVPYYVKVLKYYKHELEQMKGLWVGVEEVIAGEKPSWEDEPEQLLRDAAEEVEGIAKPDSEDGAAPYKLLQYEGWVDLPNQLRQRFCQAIVDYDTGNILSLTIQEEASWEESERFRRQEQELRTYRDQLTTYNEYADMGEEARYNLINNPALTPEQKVPLQGMLSEGAMPPPPAPPGWMKDPTDEFEEPEPPLMQPVRMFAHGVCIEPIAGNLGFGFGHIQADFNRAANTMFNQFIDAATLNNAKGWITSNLVEFKRPFDLSPGGINIAEGVTGGELKNNIIPMEPGAASPQLMEGVQMLYQWGQSSIQSPNVLSGEPGKSGETFRGISARIEQATKQLSVATRKYASPFLVQILKNNARLNSHFLDDEEFFMVNEYLLNKDTGIYQRVPQRMRVGREMYRRNYDVEIHADLKYATDAAKISDADQLVMQAMQIPQLQMNPAFVYAALKKALEARDQFDMIEKLGPEPPVPQVPMGMPPQGPQEGPAGPSGPGGPAPTGPPQ